MNLDTVTLKRLASKLRDSIEATNKLDLPIAFRNFPKGSCGDVSYILGTFIKDETGIQFDHVAGICRGRDDRLSHAWIERNGLIVDITADQFVEISEKVIVSADQTWHEQFQERKVGRADFRAQNGLEVLSHAYSLIRRESL